MTERTSAWLIERWHNSEREYWNGRGTDDSKWSRKVEDACRMAREEDAHTILAWLLESRGKVSEHIWLGDRHD